MCQLLSGTGDLVKKDTEEPEVLNAFFTSVFTGSTSLQESQAPRVRKKVWNKEDALSVEEDQVRDHLSKIDIFKSMGHDRVHPQVLKELADVIVRPISIIFERSW